MISHQDHTPARSSLAALRRREKLAWPADNHFRILSLDGGGIKGLFAAAALADLEARYLNGKSIGTFFDLITGTSTGGIIALGLASGLSARDLLEFYQREGAQIFPGGPVARLWYSVRGLGLYRYDHESLEVALRRCFGSRLMADASTRLCIPAFEGHHGEVYIFKTPHHPDYRIDGAMEITTVAQATSAAPSYFRAVEEAGYRFVDGGVWANNPVMIGVFDALACFAISPPQLRVLSLGYGRDPFRVNRARSVGGQWAWRKVIYAAMELQSQNALGQAGLLIGPENMMRLEPQLSRPIELDDWRRSSRELPPLAAELIEKYGSQIADRFLGRPAAQAQFFWPPVARLGSPHLAPAVA